MDVKVLLSFTLLLAYSAGAPSVDRNRRSGHYCYHCTDASNNTECQHATLCLDNQDRCLTQMWFSDSGIVISKRCARMQTCYIYEENNPDACSNPDDEFEGYCSFCCDGSGCNQGLPPYGPETKDTNDESNKSVEPNSQGADGKSAGPGGKSRAGGKSAGPGGKSRAGGKSAGPGGKSAGPGGKSGAGGKSAGPGGKSAGPGGKSAGPGGKSAGPGGKSGAGGKSAGPGGKSAGPGGKSVGPGSKSGDSNASGSSKSKDCKTWGGKSSDGQASDDKSSVSKTSGGSSGGCPPTKPPYIFRPQVKPQRPKTQPPVTQSPATRPPVRQPPATQPRATNPPQTQGPPATQPPATNPPQTQGPPVQNRPPQQPINVVPPCHCHDGQPCYANHSPNGQGGNHMTAVGSSGLDVSINLHIGGILFGNAGNPMSPVQGVPTCPCAQKQMNAKPAATGPTQPPNPQTVTAAPTTPKPTVGPTKGPRSPIPSVRPTTAKPTDPPTTAKPTNPPTTAKPTNPPTSAKPTVKLSPKLPTTASPTTPTTASTSTTTTTTTTTPTTTVKPVQCYKCKDLSCFDMSLVNCPTDQPYCMSTISQSATGARNFTRGCVTEQVCKNEWWLSTAGLADCFLLDGSPSGFSGLPVGKCSFCCQGDGCNKDAIPPAGTLYDPKTSPEPHPNSTATTVPPLKLTSSAATPSATVTTPLTSSSTSTSTRFVKPRPTKAAKGGLKCQICGDLASKTPCVARDLFIPKLQLCPEGQFCMIDVLHDAYGVQTTYKRCVSHTTCSRQWYHQTSDEGRCMQSQTSGVTSIDCHYCCTTPGCNTLPRPALSTLYKPK